MPTTEGPRTSRRARTAGRIGAFVALVFLMTGCIKLNMNLGINSDNTVSGTIEIGVQKELVDLTGQNVEDLLGTDAPLPGNAPGVTVEPFDDGEFVGRQVILEDVPIEEFNSGGIVGASGATGASGPTSAAGDSLQIGRQGDTFVVTGVLDLSRALSGVTGPLAGTGGAQFSESADIKIAITFPGEVLQAPGGEIDGNTVTYLPEFDERLEINATGSAVDNGEAADVVGGSDSFLPLILIISGVVLVLLIVVLLVVRGRRHEDGGGTPSGFGEAGSAAAPLAAAPLAAAPPGAPTDAPPPAPPMPPLAPPPPPPPAES
jgi:LppM domain